MTDKYLIDMLLTDQTFLDSVEEDIGKIEQLYADWDRRLIVYKTETGIKKEIDLDKVLKFLRKSNYGKDLTH